MAELFRHFGGTDLDVRWEVRVATAIDPWKELAYIEDAFVFLGRYAHFPPGDVTEFLLPELERYIKRTQRWLYAEQGLDEQGNKINRTDDQDRFR